MVPLMVVYFAEYAMQSGTWTAIGAQPAAGSQCRLGPSKGPSKVQWGFSEGGTEEWKQLGAVLRACSAACSLEGQHMVRLLIIHPHNLSPAGRFSPVEDASGWQWFHTYSYCIHAIFCALY